MDRSSKDRRVATFPGREPKNQGRWVFAEMVASCDPTLRFWLNARLLKERSLWQTGWQSLQEQEDQLSPPVK